MRQSIFLFFTTLIICTSCFPEIEEREAFDPYKQLDKDIVIIDDFLSTHNLDAIKDSTGLRYIIHDLGDTISPTINNKVEINYEGWLLSDSTRFDGGDSVTFLLRNLIGGWQIGLPKIKQGGTITLFVPSGYAYGYYGYGSIPSNANLIFRIDLIEVK